MPTNLEIEYKTLLSMPEYEHLMKLFSHVKPVRQTNHYFDTESLALRQARLALRIRTFSDHAEMTLKVPQKVGNIEHNIALTLSQAMEMINKKDLTATSVDLREILDILEEKHLNILDITCIGNLTTERREYQTNIGLAALDANQYLGASDYELELEVDEAVQGQRDFDEFLEKNQVEFRYARSKVVRFLDLRRHQNKQKKAVKS